MIVKLVPFFLLLRRIQASFGLLISVIRSRYAQYYVGSKLAEKHDPRVLDET
jgi:hypothetical protein